jgi:CysZ protein
MLDAAAKALSDMLSPPLRAVLMKSVGLALVVIVFIGVLLQRLLAHLADTGASWAEQTSGFAPHAVWSGLAWVLSFLAGLGIITGSLFLMPTVTAFVGSFFVDEIAEKVERGRYPAEPLGRALPFFRALIEGLKIALLTIVVYIFALPFLFFGIGLAILFLANAYLLSREYFELAAMRFRPPLEAKALRRANSTYLFVCGLIIALFVSIPIVNLATPIFAMAFMVHVHKRLAGTRAELVEPR